MLNNIIQKYLNDKESSNRYLLIKNQILRLKIKILKIYKIKSFN